MRHYLAYFFFFACILSGHAADTTKIGVMALKDSASVMAESQIFYQRIDTAVILPHTDYVMLKFRDMTFDGKGLQNEGEIGSYSVKKAKMVWTRPFNYTTDVVFCTPLGVLLSDGKKVTMLDFETGDLRWKGKFVPIRCDYSANVVLGYPHAKSSKLSGYDLRSGKQLWSSELSHDKNWGWHRAIREDSVHWLVTADNLNRLDIRTGEIVAYEAKTGVEGSGKTGSELAALGGLFGGAILGAAMGATLSGSIHVTVISVPFGFVPNNKNVMDLHSNVLREDSLYYFADRKSVVCLDSQMKPVWSYDLPSKTAAHSWLASNDSTLYMFSMGYGLLNGIQPKKMGPPFIAAFDKHTGKCKYLDVLSVNKDMAQDAVLSSEGAYMLFDDGFVFKHYLNSSPVRTTQWDTKTYGRLQAIVSQPVYSLSNQKDTFEAISIGGTNHLVLTDKGDVCLVDQAMRVLRHYPARSVYWPLCQQDARKCLHSLAGDRQEVWLVSQHGVPEIQFTIPVKGGGFSCGKLLLYNSYHLYTMVATTSP